MKQAMISVRTMDNACFAWLLLFTRLKSIRNESHHTRITTVISFAGVEFPMILKDISKFDEHDVDQRVRH